MCDGEKENNVRCFREENKRLRMEMQEWRSRLGEDLGKINVNLIWFLKTTLY